MDAVREGYYSFDILLLLVMFLFINLKKKKEYSKDLHLYYSNSVLFIWIDRNIVTAKAVLLCYC